MDHGQQAMEGGGGEELSLAERSGRIQGTEVPHGQKVLRSSCRVPAALGHSLACACRRRKGKGNVPAAVSA